MSDFSNNSNTHAIHGFPYVTHAMNGQWKPSSIECNRGQPDSSVNSANSNGFMDIT